MSGRSDGGPAFPCDSEPTLGGGRMPQQYAGMNLRAYFAAHAPEVPESYAWKASDSSIARVIRWRLEYADAMLGALK